MCLETESARIAPVQTAPRQRGWSVRSQGGFPRTIIGFESHDTYDRTTPCDRLCKRRRTLLQVSTTCSGSPSWCSLVDSRRRTRYYQYGDVDTAGFHWNCGQSRESHLIYIQVVDSEPFARGCYRVVCTVHSGSYGRSRI